MNCKTVNSSALNANFFEGKRIERIVTPYQNKKLPLYDWYNFNHSFSRDLVIGLIEKFELSGQDRILDPFCGSGTTLLASKEKDIPAIGIDILPLSAFVSNSKTLEYDKEVIGESMNRLQKILGDSDEYGGSGNGGRRLIAKCDTFLIV